MPYPLAAGRTTEYSSNFIPQIWSGKLQVKFYKTSVFGEISNTDYEGEIRNQGDLIKIRTIPNITIGDYTKGMNLAAQIPDSSPIELLIDKGKYFNFTLDDVDEVQADVKLLDMFTNDASEQMKISIDTNVLDGVKAAAAAANQGATAGVLSGGLNLGTVAAPRATDKTNVLDLILAAGQCLDEQNVPETGRWMVIPAWMAVQIKQSDLRQAYLTGDQTSPLRNGKIGMIDRFTVYVSNNLPITTSTKYHVMAGTRDAISFATQMTKMETIRSTSTFGNIVRGLQIFGYKVVKPEALVNMIVTKT